MLHNLDTLIAFAALMLLLSLLVTMAVQTVVTALRLRGRNLAWGLGKFLAWLDPALAPHAATLAEKVLTHARVSLDGQRVSEISPNELVVVLHELAGTEPDAELKAALQRAINQHTDAARARAAATAEAWRRQLERVWPDQASRLDAKIVAARQALSGLQLATAEWFDTAMARTTQRFVGTTRAISIAAAFALCFTLQVDTPQVLRRLSTGDATRAALIKASEQTPANAGEAATGSRAVPATSKKPPAARQGTDLAGTVDLTPPSPFWAPYGELWHWVGVLISTALVALGAPLWFNTLRRMTNLRPALADKLERR